MAMSESELKIASELCIEASNGALFAMSREERKLLLIGALLATKNEEEIARGIMNRSVEVSGSRNNTVDDKSKVGSQRSFEIGAPLLKRGVVVLAS